MRQLILLDQAAAIVGRRKAALQAYQRHQKNPLPEPAVEGCRHTPHLWDWLVLKPWLEHTFGIDLPATWPGRFVAG